MSDHNLYLRILRDRASLARIFTPEIQRDAGGKERHTQTHNTTMGINGAMVGTGALVSHGLFC